MNKIVRMILILSNVAVFVTIVFIGKLILADHKYYPSGEVKSSKESDFEVVCISSEFEKCSLDYELIPGYNKGMRKLYLACDKYNILITDDEGRIGTSVPEEEFDQIKFIECFNLKEDESFPHQEFKIIGAY